MTATIPCKAKDGFECSNCGKISGLTNYCPNCGAKMESEDKK